MLGVTLRWTGKTLYSHSASLHPGVQMGTSKFNAGGNPGWTRKTLDSHSASFHPGVQMDTSRFNVGGNPVIQGGMNADFT